MKDMLLSDRADTRRLLAKEFAKHNHHKNVIAPGVPHGGVPVAYAVADVHCVPLDAPPHFPALQSDPMARSGASSKRQISRSASWTRTIKSKFLAIILLGFLVCLHSPITANPLQILPNGNLAVNAADAHFYLLCESDDLKHWSLIGQFEGTGKQFIYSPGGTNSMKRFFRAIVYPLAYHQLKFYLDPNLTIGLSESEVKHRLSQYHQEIHDIFARQTNRRLLFDPDNDIILTGTRPDTGIFYGTLPETGYEIWIYAQLSDNPAYGTYGGSMSYDQSGAGVATNLRWDAIHDPSTLTGDSTKIEQYWRQIDHIVHELQHVWGAGFGEYYSLNIVNDTTGIDPILNICHTGWSTDSFWSDRNDYIADPLRQNVWQNPLLGSPKTLQDLRDAVQFSNTSIAVICKGHRNPTRCITETIPDLSTVEVNLRDANTGAHIPTATMQAFNIQTFSPYTATTETVTTGSHAGQFTFEWSPYPHVSCLSNCSLLKLIKANAPGYQATGRYLCVFDAQYERLFNQITTWSVDLYLSPE